MLHARLHSDTICPDFVPYKQGNILTVFFVLNVSLGSFPLAQRSLSRLFQLRLVREDPEAVWQVPLGRLREG